MVTAFDLPCALQRGVSEQLSHIASPTLVKEWQIALIQRREHQQLVAVVDRQFAELLEAVAAQRPPDVYGGWGWERRQRFPLSWQNHRP